MSKQICPYCNGDRIEKRFYPFIGKSIGRVNKCIRCNGNGKINFRFNTCDESIEWQKSHPSGLYGENRVWLGECYESLMLYLKSHETGISFDDSYDMKYSILRFDI